MIRVRRVGAIGSAAVALALLLAGCGRSEQPAADTAGAALERAAIARGIVTDPAKVSAVGLFGSASDRVCVAPAGEGAYRVGAAVDYGEGQGCFATGTATTAANGRDRLEMRFAGECRLVARLDGDRIVFPATVPAACDRFCTGRASLAALAADRISASATEAGSAVSAAGTPLCP